MVTMCADACSRPHSPVRCSSRSRAAAPGRSALSLLTMAPFAVVAPVIGPALDRLRGGRRLLVILSCLGRAARCLIMAQVVTKPSPEGLFIYPFAFGALVLSKGYSVARSSLVPSLLDDESSLVRAHSRLAVISAYRGHRRGRAGAARPAALRGRLVASTTRWSSSSSPRRSWRGSPGSAAPRPPATPSWSAPSCTSPRSCSPGSAMAILRGESASCSSSPRSRSRTTSSRSAPWPPRRASGSSGATSSRRGPRSHLREEIILAGSLLVCAVTTLFGVVLPPRSASRSRSSPSASAPPPARSASTASWRATDPTGARPHVRSLRDPVPGGVGARRLARHHPGRLGRRARGARPRPRLRRPLVPRGAAGGRGTPSRSKLRPEAVDRALGWARPNLKGGGASDPAAAGGRTPTTAAARPRAAPPPRAEPPRRRDRSAGDTATPPPAVRYQRALASCHAGRRPAVRASAP